MRKFPFSQTITKKERKLYKIKIKMMGPVNDGEPVIVFKQ